MGKIKQGILGGFSGKVGNIVGATWKGIDYIRSLPTSVANPRTPGQVNQRNKFTATQEFLSPNLAYLNVGYKFHANGMTPQNAAASYVLKNAITGTAPDFSVDYAMALVSRGKLTGVLNGTAALNGSAVDFGWADNTLMGNARPDDQAMLLVYNPSLKESVIGLEAAPREDLAGSLGFPAHFSGTSVEVFLAFQAADGRMVSNSSHLGTLAIP